jgi:hypothetical protein
MTDLKSRFPLYPFLATVALALIKTWGLSDVPWLFVFLPLFFKFAAGLAAALLSGTALAIIAFGSAMWTAIDFFRK